MRAFIFSLDSFVAFSLVLVAVYSLVFFSAIPSTYYHILTQGHYLSKDVLLTLGTTPCDYTSCQNKEANILENLVSYRENKTITNSLKRQTVDKLIPPTYGYSLQVNTSQGWENVANRNKVQRKFSVSSSGVIFDYNKRKSRLKNSPYRYLSCDGNQRQGAYSLITCDTTFNGDPSLNQPPSKVLGGNLEPSYNISGVRLVVYR